LLVRKLTSTAISSPLLVHKLTTISAPWIQELLSL
jgi:hypothetical protein